MWNREFIATINFVCLVCINTFFYRKTQWIDEVNRMGVRISQIWNMKKLENFGWAPSRIGQHGHWKKLDELLVELGHMVSKRSPALCDGNLYSAFSIDDLSKWEQSSIQCDDKQISSSVLGQARTLLLWKCFPFYEWKEYHFFCLPKIVVIPNKYGGPFGAKRWGPFLGRTKKRHILGILW